jgi:hypothetical protein
MGGGVETCTTSGAHGEYDSIRGSGFETGRIVWLELGS